uniref:LIM zinc-binding domain-containing protein n=1 Tax=Mesocestoides corti TaxID=53468 RepID=A0A5K3F7N9_MESCO
MRSPTPPPPPPYAAKHTIIAAPPAVSNRTPATSPPSLVGKLPSLDPAGHRVSTALNITFSPTPSFASSSSSPARKSPSRPDTFGQVGGGGGFSVSAEVPRRHTVQRISSSSASIATPATASHGTAPPEWKPGVCSKCGARITNAASACQAMGCLYHDFCFVCCCCQRTLRGKTFYKDQDKIYCEDDYLYCGFQRMAEKCVACGHIIAQTVSRSGLSTQLSAVGSSNRFFDWADCGCCVRLILSQFSAGVCA